MSYTGDPSWCAICHSTAAWQPHNCPSYGLGYLPIVPTTIPTPCEHCFCQDATSWPLSKPHEQCCMCQTKRLKVAP